MVWCCVAWGLNICLFTSGSSGEEDGERETNKTRGRQWEGKREARGFTSEVVSLHCVGSVRTVARKGHYNIFFRLSYSAIISTYLAIGLNYRAIISQFIAR